ncbi:MAG TPA: hypothetical protein PLT26_09170 [Anaerolineaceae bacterium]|nr:hypothetical protein [Anaerolineaceae bacterium]HQH85714.1 hypothetical protein [Anaerolineaceae bacterium]
MNDVFFGGGIVLMLIIILPMSYFIGKSQCQKVGLIKCRQCQHVGEPKPTWFLFKGYVPACANCHSKEWDKVAR